VGWLCTRVAHHEGPCAALPDTATNPAGWADRHPSVAHFRPLFEYGHLPIHLQLISEPFANLAAHLLNQLSDGPELTAGLRKLVEAKDCAVRQAVIDRAVT
jgi:hypothetical protein